MVNEPARTVSDLGEVALVDRIAARLDPAPSGEVWSGDDAAVVAWDEGALLVATDMLVDGVDFDLAYCTGEDVGWKALAASLSDIAAMGGWPVHSVVSLALPAGTRLETFDGILEGLVGAGREWGVALVGGDLSEGRTLVISVTMTGEMGARRIVRRVGALPGDAICITGTLGGAAGGLQMLREGRSRVGARGRLAERQLRPRARIREGSAIAEAGATAMIDVSDGLVVDLWRLMEASGTGCQIHPDLIPVDPDLDALPGAGLEMALVGGEDFELLFTISPRRLGDVTAALARVGVPATRIGTVVDEGLRLGDEPLELWKQKAWQHLRAP